MLPKITDFIQSLIWERPFDQLPKWQSPLIKQARVLILAFKASFPIIFFPFLSVILYGFII